MQTFGPQIKLCLQVLFVVDDFLLAVVTQGFSETPGTRDAAETNATQDSNIMRTKSSTQCSYLALSLQGNLARSRTLSMPPVVSFGGKGSL